jgi:hypothetical protein
VLTVDGAEVTSSSSHVDAESLRDFFRFFDRPSLDIKSSYVYNSTALLALSELDFFRLSSAFSRIEEDFLLLLPALLAVDLMTLIVDGGETSASEEDDECSDVGGVSGEL